MREPYATMIVRGEKEWEIRKKKTNIRGKVYIISNGHIIGSAKLVDVLGPFSAEELAEYKDKHKVDYEFLKDYSQGKMLYAWVFKDAEEFETKKPIKIPKGAQVWVRI